MASTKWCLQCGGEFLASVERCPDCDLELVDERPEPALPDDATGGGEVLYDLAEWAAESRVMLEQLLEGEAVPHAWQGATLHVPVAFEARADNLVDHVEVATLPTLDPDADQVAYDLSDWSDDLQTHLVQILVTDGIPHEFDVDGDLVVLAEDEERVERLIDAVEFPDALPIDDGDRGDDQDDAEDDDAGDGDAAGDDDGGVDAQQVLSDLFVAADRLMHDARDHEGVLSLVDAADRAEAIRLPYGFDPAVWKDIVGQAIGLRAVFEGTADDESDEAIEHQARDLRGALRPLV
ncbi:MAG: hypothetical protein U0Q07_14045 [Acidimicrobiales bacterium]